MIFNDTLVKCKCTCHNSSRPYGDVYMAPLSHALKLVRTKDAIILDDPLAEAPNTCADAYMYRKSFSPVRRTRVLWVQNYVKKGGAEISNYVAVETGTRLGFDIVGYDIDTPLDRKLITECDLIVVNNMHTAGRDAMLGVLFNSGKPWVKYEHDYLESGCVGLFTVAAMLVFISPAQAEHYFKLFGEDIKEKSVVLPLAIQEDRWQDKNEPRIPNTVLVPAYDKCRGNTLAFMTSHPEYKYHVLSQTGIKPSGALLLPSVEWNRMQDIYNQYEIVLHQPDAKYAGDRVLFEATLCGCRVIHNENVGHLSWNYDLADHKTLRDNLTQALYRFWYEIDTRVVASLPNKVFVKSRGKKTVGIITRCMNRKSFLKQALPTWVKFPIDKIVIVDWGMKEDLSDLLIDDRVTIIQVPGVDKYDMGIPNNIAARYLDTDYLFCVDADVMFNEHSAALRLFLEKVKTGCFPPVAYARQVRSFCPLSGTALYERETYHKANGFYEGLPCRGMDELDMFFRLTNKVGAKGWSLFYPGMFIHIDHDNTSRVENFKEVKSIQESDKTNAAILHKADPMAQKHEQWKCNIVTRKGTQEGVMV